MSDIETFSLEEIHPDKYISLETINPDVSLSPIGREKNSLILDCCQNCHRQNCITYRIFFSNFWHLSIYKVLSQWTFKLRIL